MKKTYADVAAMLAKKKRKYEEKLNSSDVLARNSATRMLQRIDSSLDNLFDEQEASKPKMKNGGYIKMGNGGEPESTAPADYMKFSIPQHMDPRLQPFLDPLGYFGAVPNYGKIGSVPATQDSSKPKDFGLMPRLDIRKARGYGQTYHGATPKRMPGPVTQTSTTTTPATAKRKVISPSTVVAKTQTVEQAPVKREMITAPNALPTLNSFKEVKPPSLGKTPLSPFSNAKGRKPLTINTDGLLRAASFALPFAEVGAGRRSIDRMAPPPSPLLEDPVRMNTNFNINPQLIDARKAQTTLNNAANSNVSSASANALRALGFVTRLDQAGKAYTMKENAENQMKNRLAGINSQVAGRNVNRLNYFNDAATRFKNDREVAIFNNNRALFDRLQTAVTDMRLESRDKKMLQLMAKQYDPGVVRRALGDTGYEKLLQLLGSAGDSESKQMLEKFKNAK